MSGNRWTIPVAQYWLVTVALHSTSFCVGAVCIARCWWSIRIWIIISNNTNLRSFWTWMISLKLIFELPLFFKSHLTFKKYSKNDAILLIQTFDTFHLIWKMKIHVHVDIWNTTYPPHMEKHGHLINHLPTPSCLRVFWMGSSQFTQKWFVWELSCKSNIFYTISQLFKSRRISL